jgi:Ni,Fe-hydrogenase III large subunit
VIETVAEQVVTNIAQTPANTATLQRQVVEELKEVGTVARTSGWEKTAQATAAQLRMLGETMGDATAKNAAENAADRLSEPAAS